MTRYVLNISGRAAGYAGASRSHWLYSVVGVVGFALLTVGGAAVRIPLPTTPVPMTLQTLPVLLAGVVLGPWRGAGSQLLYLALGLVGFPFFAGGGHGFEHMMGASAGYLVGFLVAPLAAGYVARAIDGGVRGYLLASVVATVIIFAMGIGWLMAGHQLAITRALEWGLYPFLLGAVIKIGLATSLAGVSWRAGRRIW